LTLFHARRIIFSTVARFEDSKSLAMIEISYAIIVWSVAIVFQAAVHYSLKRRKRLQEATLPAAGHLSSPLPVCDNGSLDGDEPPVFFELLTQTGSEMMNVCDKSRVSVFRKSPTLPFLTPLLLFTHTEP
jgi:hypothetical protein